MTDTSYHLPPLQRLTIQITKILLSCKSCKATHRVQEWSWNEEITWNMIIKTRSRLTLYQSKTEKKSWVLSRSLWIRWRLCLRINRKGAAWGAGRGAHTSWWLWRPSIAARSPGRQRARRWGTRRPVFPNRVWGRLSAAHLQTGSAPVGGAGSFITPSSSYLIRKRFLPSSQLKKSPYILF